MENSQEFMEKGDELLLHGCVCVLLGLLPDAKASLLKLKRLHPKFFGAEYAWLTRGGVKTIGVKSGKDVANALLWKEVL